MVCALLFPVSLLINILLILFFENRFNQSTLAFLFSTLLFSLLLFKRGLPPFMSFIY
jgi:hypothetical protein